jgi:hypothetical protein
LFLCHNFNNLFWVNFSQDEINRIFEVWHAHNVHYLLDASTCSLNLSTQTVFGIYVISDTLFLHTGIF